MELPTYVSLDEARAACDRLRIRDWTKLRDPVVEVEEAVTIQREIGAEADEISLVVRTRRVRLSGTLPPGTPGAKAIAARDLPAPATAP